MKAFKEGWSISSWTRLWDWYLVILSFASSTKAGQVSEDSVLVDITDKPLDCSRVELEGGAARRADFRGGAGAGDLWRLPGAMVGEESMTLGRLLYSDLFGLNVSVDLKLSYGKLKEIFSSSW
jgi:hypothetical protein